MHSKVSASILFFSLVAGSLILAGACAPVVTTIPGGTPPPDSSSLTELPTVLPPETASVLVGTICPPAPPPDEGLPDDPKYKVEFGNVFDDGTGLQVREGKYTNEVGQVFWIVVRGYDAGAVTEYTDSLRVCLELLDASAQTFPAEASPPEADLIPSEPYPGELVLLKANPGNLAIYSYPDETNRKSFADGYVFSFLFDPPISGGITHNYTKYCRDSASARVRLGASGGISSTFYWGASSSAIRLSPNGSCRADGTSCWSKNGHQTYDLSVTGTAAGSYRYSVSGTVWNRGFDSPTPSGGGSGCG